MTYLLIKLLLKFCILYIKFISYTIDLLSLAEAISYLSAVRLLGIRVSDSFILSLDVLILEKGYFYEALDVFLFC